MNIYEKYIDTIQNNLNHIKKILENNFTQSNEILDTTINKILKSNAESIVSLWKSGKKPCRTFFAKQIIPKYPESVLETSLLIDAAVNIFDDLYDEEPDKEKKLFYISELIRIFSNLLISKNLKDEIKIKVSRYIDSIIVIAAAEMIITQKIAVSKSDEEKIKNAVDCYNSRSIGMDIYIELPLVELYGDSAEIRNMVHYARIFRAVSIIENDLIDLKHDMELNILTPVVALYAIKDRKKFKNYINQIIRHYKEENNRIFNLNYSKNFKKIAINIEKLITSKIKEIENILLKWEK